MKGCQRSVAWQAAALVAVVSVMPRWFLIPEDAITHTVNNYLSLSVFALCILAAWYSSTDEA